MKSRRTAGTERADPLSPKPSALLAGAIRVFFCFRPPASDPSHRLLFTPCAPLARIPIMTESTPEIPALSKPVQCVGPDVQRNPVRTFSSNRHSTARSRCKGTSAGTSVRTPSALATIVVRLVADASVLVMSIAALGKACRMVSAQRSASPTLRGMPHPALTQQSAAERRTVEACRKGGMPPILLGRRENFKPGTP